MSSGEALAVWCAEWINVRRRQAGGLRKWAEAQSLPLLAIGDYNFDYDFHMEVGNKAFQLFTKGGVWKWLRP